MKDLRVIAIAHQDFPLEVIGRFHLAGTKKTSALNAIRKLLPGGEVMYLATCNRVEIVFTASHFVCPGLCAQILRLISPTSTEDEILHVSENARRFSGEDACLHVLRLTSSLESVIVGEREIITQFRKAYEESHEAGITGDVLRILTRQAIETAKEIFTHTHLSRKPVSVASIAWSAFKEEGFSRDIPILMVGAGQIVSNYLKFLIENGYNNITIANRTLSNAEILASKYDGVAPLSLDSLSNCGKKFQVIVACTSAPGYVVTSELFDTLRSESNRNNMTIDLALPANIDPEIKHLNNVTVVTLETIQQIAENNIEFRKLAIEECEPIIQAGLENLENTWMQREIEIAMKSIPGSIKEIRDNAVNSVFARDLDEVDPKSRELIERILNYMEKKYISIPMKMAREVLLENIHKN